jgi:hypothetical protein
MALRLTNGAETASHETERSKMSTTMIRRIPERIHDLHLTDYPCVTIRQQIRVEVFEYKSKFYEDRLWNSGEEGWLLSGGTLHITHRDIIDGSLIAKYETPGRELVGGTMVPLGARVVLSRRLYRDLCQLDLSQHVPS